MTHERHPLLVEDVSAGGEVGGDVAANGVALVLGTVGVELTTRVTGDEVLLGAIPETVDLDVEGSLDELRELVTL